MNCAQTLLQSPFAADLINLIHEYIDEWLFQVFSGISKPLRFGVFFKLWKETNFEVILLCHPKRLKQQQFLQQLFQTVLLFFEHPFVTKLPRVDEYLKELNAELQHVTRIACVYTLYLLYVSQKVEDTREKIRVDISSFKALLQWMTLEKQRNGEDGKSDAFKLFVNLLQEKAFRLCYLKLPLQLPQSLMEPLSPPMVCKYELGVDCEENSSKKRYKSSKTYKNSTNSEIDSFWTRIGEILTSLELERLEKSWKRWKDLSKLLREQRPDISRFSDKDSFHEEMLKVLESVKSSAAKQ